MFFWQLIKEDKTEAKVYRFIIDAHMHLPVYSGLETLEDKKIQLLFSCWLTLKEIKFLLP